MIKGENKSAAQTKDAEILLLQFCSGTTAHGFSYLTKTSIADKIFLDLYPYNLLHWNLCTFT